MNLDFLITAEIEPGGYPKLGLDCILQPCDINGVPRNEKAEPRKCPGDELLGLSVLTECLKHNMHYLAVESETLWPARVQNCGHAYIAIASSFCAS